MTENKPTQDAPGAPPAPSAPQPDGLDRGTYEVIRNRLLTQGKALRERLDKLNVSRKETFGSIELTLLSTERIQTPHNCVPRDMVPVGNRFIFGYNVFFGLKSETRISDVFAVYEFNNGNFRELPLDLISNSSFESDFKDLYKYYKQTRFAKFAVIGPHLFMIFQVGRTPEDIKTFKWAIHEDRLEYLDNRSDHQYKLPPQHEFEWVRTHRDLHRFGTHPHISIEDRIFVETVGGDLTIKIEDNTETGEGIYSEPVVDKDQTLDDAEIFYASLGNLILLKIRPYQEKDFRYIVYSEKIRRAIRLDAIANACVLLPDNQGIIYSHGYYLQNGEHKEYEGDISGLKFERLLPSPNGEDFLYMFHNPSAGMYILLSYNLIEQKVDNPLICGGYSLFEDGKMINFKEAREASKHHSIQVWQTPYVGPNYVAPAKQDSLLYKIGNRDIVRCMAEMREVISLCERDDTFANLYLDIVKKTGDILDAYFWVDKPEAFNPREIIVGIKETAHKAVDEFDKVNRIRKATREQTRTVSEKVKKILGDIMADLFADIDSYVKALASLRGIRGDIIALRDLRYVDSELVAKMEKENEDNTVSISARCVEFLLKPDALEPYRKKVQTQRARVESLKTGAEAKVADKEALEASNELQMLIEIVGNLKIEDAVQRTRIIDAISLVFAQLNQIRAGIKQRSQELAVVEGQAEFSSQVKLLTQSIVNAIDVCDSPEKCDEMLTKVMVQIEELEGKFADFDKFVIALSEKRQEAYGAFESRKVALVEARTKRASGLMTAAERILKGVESRASKFQSPNEIHGFFASDLMVDKIRDIVGQLRGLHDSVKADDLETRLKTLREEAIRQLKDRQELFLDGENILKLGNHRFSVNRQPLDLTTVVRDGEMYFHLTGTNFFEKVAHPDFAGFRPFWNQETVSENDTVYRGEYLAYCAFKELESGPPDSVSRLNSAPPMEVFRFIQNFMAPRYSEGYTKGVHDHDAALILKTLVEIAPSVGLLRYSPSARTLAELFWKEMARSSFFWSQLGEDSAKSVLEAKLQGVGAAARLFPGSDKTSEFRNDLASQIKSFAQKHSVFPPRLVGEAAEFLFISLSRGIPFPISREAAEIVKAFHAHLREKGSYEEFRSSTDRIKRDTGAVFLLFRTWMEGFLAEEPRPDGLLFLDEAAWLLFEETVDPVRVGRHPVSRDLEGLVGSHALVEKGKYRFQFNSFMSRLSRFQEESVPRYEAFLSLKKALSGEKRAELKLEEFKARVLTTFVRNKLLDQVFLPLIGSNLAKQLGTAGDDKQTDRMGLLLLISPPGYGKTTLMEYVANRLGVVFIKVNGPAIGNKVTSLDPAEAPFASAREELNKLNLSLVMGDNVMIYVDDIQHCSPEFLEKFISLCDAQRKIEGVFQGKSRTFDLRGRKVAVVMAGNPYTESGERFQIPDMLANRADTFNLGDIVGGAEDSFRMSYLENAAGSNPVLSRLASSSPKDLQAVIRLAETGGRENVELEGGVPLEEVQECVNTMKKLVRVRDVVLAVNREYIASAAQADAYRTQPPFKLQGSYRNMNRMAEKILPIMNDAEVEELIAGHYQNEAQTLTTGAEFNLLRFKELLGKLSADEGARLEEIRKTFKKNQMLKGVGSEDRIGQLIAQLSTFEQGLDGIRQVLSQGLTNLTDKKKK